MKANFLALGLFGLAGASAILPRDDYPTKDPYEPDYKPVEYKPKPPKPDYPAKPYPSKEPKYDSYPSKPPPPKYDSYPSKAPPPPPKYDSYPYKAPPAKYDSYPSKAPPPKDSYPAKPPPPQYGDDYATSPDYANEDDYETGYDYKNSKGSTSSWKPKSKSPEFFNLRIDEKCNVVNGVLEPPTDCPFNGYAIRLEGGIFIATPYNKWWDPKLPTFFVDDDTQLYTVSKDPLQVYIDGITGALKYTKIGWLPPNAIAISFYHTGNNPLGLVDPSPSYLSWPSTQGGSFFGSPWVLCPLGSTQQYQVFINSENFGIGGPAGVAKDPGTCASRNLAAVNANPWKQDSSPAPYYPPQPYSGYGH